MDGRVEQSNAARRPWEVRERIGDAPQLCMIATRCVRRSRSSGTPQEPPGGRKAARYTFLHRVNKTYDFRSEAKNQRLYMS